MRPIDADDLWSALEIEPDGWMKGRIIKMYIDEAPTIAPEGQWISVEDHLPTEKKIIDGEVYYRHVLVLTEDPKMPEQIGYYDEQLECWMLPAEPFFGIEVTHWMPLPKPLKEGNE